MRLLFILFIICCTPFLVIAQDFDIRFNLSSVNVQNNQICYNVQIKPNGIGSFNLAGQNYRIFYNSGIASYASGVSTLPSQYGSFTLVQNIQDLDGDEVNGSLSFEATIGFLNYGMDLNNSQNGGIVLASGQWTTTSNLCFNVEASVFTDPNIYLEFVWAREGMTDEYATAFVEISRWVSPNFTVNSIGINYNDLDLNDGYQTCYNVSCSPQANDDQVTAEVDIPRVIEILGNDDFLSNEDPNIFGTTTVTLLAGGNAQGSIVLDTLSGDLTYTPIMSEIGTTVELTYEVCTDGFVTIICDTANVQISVVFNDSPIAVHDTLSTTDNVGTLIEILQNDTIGSNGLSTINILSYPGNGIAVIDDNGTVSDLTDDVMNYTSFLGYSGVDTIEYEICDNDGDCSMATVQIMVTSTNTSPVAVNDSINTGMATGILIDVLMNDVIGSSGLSLINIMSYPQKGAAFIDDNGTVSDFTDDRINYLPNNFFKGLDSLKYQICNGNGDCSVGTVFVIVSQNYDIRFNMNSINCNTNQVCYDVQLKPIGSGGFNLGGQNYRIFYNASLLGYSSGVSTLPPQYTDFILVEDLQEIDAGDVNGSLSFESTLGFLNYAIDLDDTQNGGINLFSNEWTTTSNICFDVEPTVINDPNTCVELVWGRTGLTNEYATAFVEVSRWVSTNKMTFSVGINYDDLDFNDGNQACFNDPLPPTAPVVGTVTQPTCTISTGSVVLSGLPTGSWTITRMPGDVTTTGNTTTTTISGLLPGGTYTFTVENANTCVSAPSSNVVINELPSDPVLGGADQVCLGSIANITPNVGGTWMSSDTTVATVNNVGEVEGLGVGTVTLTFTQTSTGCFATKNFTVNALPTLTGANDVCIGSTANVGPNTGGTWMSSNDSIATVSNAGVVSGINVGTVNLTYSESGTNCIATKSFTVLPDNTVSSNESKTLCINTVLSPSIIHITTGASGIGTATGLPTGLTASWSDNTITIIGTPIVAGTFNYSIPLTGGCGAVNAIGTIVVAPDNTAAMVATTTLCINTEINRTQGTTGATGIGMSTGLPLGVTATWASDTITFSGSPTESGTFNYSIPLTGGCGTVDATGTIEIIPDNTAATIATTTLCINTPITRSQSTTGATGIGMSTGLPAGVTATWASDTITFSGSPTVSGTFNYSIPLTGGCGMVDATGTIVLTVDTAVVETVATTTLCIQTEINRTQGTIGATGIGMATGLPAGVTVAWSSDTITFSGSPTVSGTFNYSIPLIGGCGTVDATGTIVVTPENTATTVATTTLCINTPISRAQATTGATGIGVAIGLPAGLTATWASDTITFSGSPTVSGTFNYSIPLTGGCGTVDATGTIEVIPDNTAAPVATTTLCINTEINRTQGTIGATGITMATGLPAGVTAMWAANTITFSGSPTVSGTFNYSIPLTGGCGTVAAAGTIEVNGLPILEGVSTVCVGNTANITPNTGGSWMSSNMEEATVTNNGIVTGLAEGTVTLTFTETSTGCISTKILNVVTCLSPDFGLTYINMPLTGDVSTNDKETPGSSYGNPPVNNSNPSPCTPVISSNGTYTFICGTIGVYNFYVPVCEPAPNQSVCTSVLLQITLLPENDPLIGPIANPDYVTTLQNTSISLPVTTNDRCQNGTTCTLGMPTVITAPLHGSFNTGTGVYTPALNYVGIDSFYYQVCDNQVPSMCTEAWAYITMEPTGTGNLTNAMDDYAQTPYQTPVNGDVKTNDTDPEGNVQTVTPQTTTIAGKGTLVLASTGLFTFTPVNGFYGPVQFPYTTCDNGTPQACATATVHILVQPQMCITTNLKVLLEGPYVDNGNNGSTMTTKLNSLGYLPGQKPSTFFGTAIPAGQPYSGAPWNYNGGEGALYNHTPGMPATYKANYPSTITDWVLVSLRENINTSSTICTKAALLHSNGTIQMVSGFDCCNLDLAKTYYVVVEHRNHLLVMSHVKVAIVNNSITYDFTAQQSYKGVFGFGQNFIEGKYVMFTGNGEQSISSTADTDINVNDKDGWLVQIGRNSSFYKNDFDLNGDVNVQDKNIWLDNNGRFSDVPR